MEWLSTKRYIATASAQCRTSEKMYAISLGGKSAEKSFLKLCDKYWEYSIQSTGKFNKNIIEESNI